MPITYFRGLHGCILVYDITDTNSFNALNQLKDDTLLWSSPEDAEHFPLILLGNKCDLSEDKKVSKFNLIGIIETNSNYSPGE